ISIAREAADPPILVLASIVLQKSPSPLGPALRLLQPRSRNLASFPSRAAQDRHETPSARERAARATEQNISEKLRLPRRSAGSSSAPRSTTVAARATIPFLRATCQAESRTYSPHLLHSPQAELVDASRLLRRCG